MIYEVIDKRKNYSKKRQFAVHETIDKQTINCSKKNNNLSIEQNRVIFEKQTRLLLAKVDIKINKNLITNNIITINNIVI